MFVCVDWVREITPFEVSIEELADTLTMLGLEVEEIIEPFSYLKSVVVGHVKKCNPHPKADKLKVCLVDIGDEVLKIVCGAPNIKEEQSVAVAKIGTILPDGLEVKKVKIRGEESLGMICSEKELGLGDDHSGIMELEKKLSPGTSLTEALRLDHVVFDIGITPNRGDCLSIIGIAREISAYYNLPLHLPKVSLNEIFENISLEIEIKNPERCYLYQAKLVKDVKVKPSPSWMKYRLIASGIRPINNIVDITNYVMLETGHPLHAFDFALIEGEKIKIDTAKEDQIFITLDGKKRTLNSEDLLILDSKKPVALAGIMGGENSEIHESTKHVLIECAVFDPISVRKTARRLGISTESSYRFERGVDQKNAEYPLKRAAYLMQKLADARVVKGIIKKEPKPWTPIEIRFRPRKVKQLLDLDIEESKSLEILNRFGCEIKKTSNSSTYTILPPSFRHDLTREVDLIEEIARFCGYDKIPEELPRVTKSSFVIDARRADTRFVSRIKKWAKGSGLKEVINYSFVSLQELELLGFSEENLIKIQNPLTSEQDTLRPLIVPGLLKCVSYNLSQNNKNLRFFEVASVFVRDESHETKTKEITKLGIIIQGSRNPDFWPWNVEKVDYLEIKGMVEHLFENLGIVFDFKEADSHSFLEPWIKVIDKQKELGFIGRVKKEVCKFYDLKDENLWVAEIDLDELWNLYNERKIKFSPWSKYPPVFRDMTIILLKELKFKEIKETINKSQIPHIEEVKLVDIYKASNDSNPHFTLRFVYRHPQRTLTDKEVDDLHMKLGQLLLNKLPIRFP